MPERGLDPLTESLPVPYYDEDGITIYHAAQDEVIDAVPRSACVFTDPPYGINYVSSRGETIHGDDTPYDPNELLQQGFARHVIWGANHFAHPPPLTAGRGIIVWDKRDQVSRRLPGSDAEIAWTDTTRQVRIFREVWIPHTLRTERRYHPTQKPVRLCRTIIEELFPPESPVFDPFMGSGTTLRAAADLGRHAIGIEIDERYCEIAVRRLAQRSLFAESLSDG